MSDNLVEPLGILQVAGPLPAGSDVDTFHVLEWAAREAMLFKQSARIKAMQQQIVDLEATVLSYAQHSAGALVPAQDQVWREVTSGAATRSSCP
tara:strand:- start:679 stop:960 length:282 start_codon:yes stop_codon:yes gene_type:complete